MSDDHQGQAVTSAIAAIAPERSQDRAFRKIGEAKDVKGVIQRPAAAAACYTARPLLRMSIAADAESACRVVRFSRPEAEEETPSSPSATATASGSSASSSANTFASSSSPLHATHRTASEDLLDEPNAAGHLEVCVRHHNIVQSRDTHKSLKKLPKKLLLAAGALAACLLTIILLVRYQLTEALLLDGLASLYEAATRHPILYTCLSIVAIQLFIICCIPISILIVVIALAFKWWALLIAYPFTVIGSSISFFLGRLSCFEFLKPRLYRQQHLLALHLVLNESPFKYCLLLRLSPIPLFIKNYGLSALGVPFRPFFLSSCISAIPWTVAEVAIGSSAQSVAEAWRSDNPAQSATRLAVMCFGVVVLLTTSYMLIRAYRAKLARQFLPLSNRFPPEAEAPGTPSADEQETAHSHDQTMSSSVVAMPFCRSLSLQDGRDAAPRTASTPHQHRVTSSSFSTPSHDRNSSQHALLQPTLIPSTSLQTVPAPSLLPTCSKMSPVCYPSASPARPAAANR